MDKIKNVLVLNGSPKNERSATMMVTNAFLDGLNSNNSLNIEVINVSDLNIKPCLGCLSCWGKTEGECIIKTDDIIKVKNKILDSDLIIESYPLYFFGMPGIMKILTDRLLSMMKTYRGQKAPIDGSSYHGLRYNMENKKLVLISSCAYSDVDLAYKSLLIQYDCIFGANYYTPILVPELKTLIDINNKIRLDKMLSKFKDAGKTFYCNGYLNDDILKDLKKEPFSPQVYKVLLDNFWKDEKKY